MKKTLAFAVLICVSTLLIAQETKSRFSVGAYVSPTVSSRIFSGDDAVPNEFVTILKNIEGPKAGFSTGLLATYSFNRKIALQTGVSFSNNGYLDKKATYNGEPEGLTAFKTIYHSYYVDVPVQVKYTFLEKGKFSFYAVGGMEANFNIANKQTLVQWYGDDKERSRADQHPFGGAEFRKYNLSVTAGVGVDYAVSKKVSLFLQTTYRQMLLTQIADSPLNRRLYSLGLDVGIRIHF